MSQTQLLEVFNANAYMPWGGGSPVLPVGEKQLVTIESGEVKGSIKDASNGQIVLNLRIHDGVNAGKSGALTLSIYHQNPKTVEIAKSKFSAVCHVVGFPSNVQNLQQLYNIPFRIDVIPQTDTKYTDVSNFYDQYGNPPGKQAAPAGPQFAQGQAPTAPQQQQFQAQAPVANQPFTPPVGVAFNPAAAAPVAGITAPAGGAFPGAVAQPQAQPEQQQPQFQPSPVPSAAGPGFAGGFPTPPQQPGTAPAPSAFGGQAWGGQR